MVAQGLLVLLHSMTAHIARTYPPCTIKGLEITVQTVNVYTYVQVRSTLMEGTYSGEQSAELVSLKQWHTP